MLLCILMFISYTFLLIFKKKKKFRTDGCTRKKGYKWKETFRQHTETKQKRKNVEISERGMARMGLGSHTDHRAAMTANSHLPFARPTPVPLFLNNACALMVLYKL
jgi:hypothetical protein